MLRLSSGVLVVPPFECAWLTGDGYTLRNGSGCISFEAKGDTDATVILKSTPGAKRLQPLRQTAAPGVPGQPGGNALQVEENYTIIFGSHRNSCLKIEKNGVTQCMVPGVPCSRVSNKVFSKFWIDLNHGVLTIGHGEPGEGVCHQWRDAHEIPGIQHIGLSCWDRHVSYRSIALHPALDFTRLQQQQASRPAPGSSGPVPPLFDATVSAIMAATTPANVCNTLHVAELLLPTTQKLYRYSLDFIARHFRTVARDHPDALLAVSPAAMVDLVCQNTFSVDEHEIFAAVRDWACAHLAARGMGVGGGRPAEGQVQQRVDEEEEEEGGQRHRGVGELLHAVRVDEEDKAGQEEGKAGERQRVPDPDREAAGTEPGSPAARKGLHIGTGGVGGRDMGPPTPPQTQAGSSPRPTSSPHCTVSSKATEGTMGLAAGASGADAAAGLWAWADASAAPEGTSRPASSPQLPAVRPQLAQPPAATAAAVVAPLPLNWAQTGRASLDCRAPDPLLPPGAVRPPSHHPVTAARTCSLTSPAPPYHHAHAQGTSPGSPRTTPLKHVASCSSLPEQEEDAEALEAACRVLSLIRFPLLPIDHLHACLADPLLSRLPHHRVMALVHEALEVHARETGAGAWPQLPLPVAAASAAGRPGGGPGAAAGAGAAASAPLPSSLSVSVARQGSGDAVGGNTSRSSSSCLGSAGPSGQMGDIAGGASANIPQAAAAASAPFAAASTTSTTPSGAAPPQPPGGSASSASPTPGRSAGGPLVDPWSGAVRYQRRCLPFALELMYVCDGDSCGVLHFLGTQYGSQGWVNPMLAKRVDVRASSPTGRTTDPRVIAGRQFVRTNFAGPRYVNGAASSWWMVDLGAQHRLGITYYTLRHDGSNDYARSWVLQGSSDLTSWVDLKRHANDTTIKVPGQYASWPVIGPAAAVPYRAFRLLLTGPNASPNPATRNTFSLSNLELYGYLSKGGSGGEEGVEGGGPGPGSAGGSGA